MTQALVQQNRLLTERNALLQQENQRLLDQLQCLKLQSMSKTLDTYDPPIQTLRFITQERPNSILQIQREQLNQLVEEKLPILHKKILPMINCSIKDKIKMLEQMNVQSIFTGFFRLLFETVEQSLDQIKKSQTDKKMPKTEYVQKQTLLFVKDPNYITEELKWVTKFSDQFEIVRSFYEKLIKTMVEKYSINKRTEISLILHKFSELESCKLELYKLAVKVDNQQRDYEVRTKAGRSTEVLQVEISNTLEKITFQENCLKEYKGAINKYLKRI